jgi:IS5 family transposase
MVGRLMSKYLYGIGGECIPEFWVRRLLSVLLQRNIFEHKFPFDPSDFVHFRNRIGEVGIEKITVCVVYRQR